MYRFDPTTVILYNTEDEKNQARRKVFDLMVYVMYPHQLTQTKVVRELSPNVEVTLMVHVMSLHQFQQTMVARDFSPNMETMVARGLSLNVKT